MRLISQDGKGDMPYENFIFRVHGGDIVASRDILIDKKPIVAKYSTEAKALKVMEMLREEYLKHIYGSGGEMATRDLYIPPFAFIPPKVFKFPDDEEVEV